MQNMYIKNSSVDKTYKKINSKIKYQTSLSLIERDYYLHDW